MLSETEAYEIVRSVFPDSSIISPVVYRGSYLFQVIGNDPLEGDQDPFFSVNTQTGELRDFSILTDGDPKEIEKLFLNPQTLERFR